MSNIPSNQVTIGEQSNPFTSGKLDSFNIPAYDTQVIDESAAPTTTTITYTLAGVTVAVKTITVSGTTTTITIL